MKINIKNRTDKVYIIIFTLVISYIVYLLLNSLKLPQINWQGLSKFNTLFISILLQAFPFVLIGTFVSSIINEFVSEEFITRVFPKRKIPSYIAAIAFGILFPVCDCAVVPVAARLAKKGVPVSTAIMFMLSAPIINPVVIASTLYAFPDSPKIAIIRVILGITIAIIVGETIACFSGTPSSFFKANQSCSCNHDHDSYKEHSSNCSCNSHDHDYSHRYTLSKRIINIFSHMGEEFFSVGKFLIVGAFVSVAFQCAATTEWLGNFDLSRWSELLVMMACGFVLSICSTSDAFIAKSFLNQFSLTAAMGFMILGPMIDIKNTLMLSGSFPKRFVAKLIAVIFIEAFIIIFFALSIPIFRLN